jgi:hypothetical protein
MFVYKVCGFVGCLQREEGRVEVIIKRQTSECRARGEREYVAWSTIKEAHCCRVAQLRAQAKPLLVGEASDKNSNVWKTEP